MKKEDFDYGVYKLTIFEGLIGETSTETKVLVKNASSLACRKSTIDCLKEENIDHEACKNAECQNLSNHRQYCCPTELSPLGKDKLNKAISGMNTFF